MVGFLQVGILLLISLMANKRCINSSLSAPPILGMGGTGFAIRPRNTEEKEGIEARQRSTREVRNSPHNTGRGSSDRGGVASKSEARCLAEKAHDQVKRAKSHSPFKIPKTSSKPPKSQWLGQNQPL